MYEEYMRRSDGLHGMYFGSFRCVVAPDSVSLGIHLNDTELVGNENVTVGQQYGIADFTFTLLVFVGPVHVSVLDDEHAHAFALSCIEEIVT